MGNKEIKILIPVIIIVLITLIVIYAFYGITGGAIIVSESDEVVKVGVIQPLTGKTAYVGEWVVEGLELALDEINKDKKKIELIYEDDACNTKLAVNSVKKLIEIDRVAIIMGPTCSSSVLAVAPIAEENEVIILSTVATTSKISEAGDYIFRNRESDALHGIIMAEFAFHNLGARKAAILYLNLDNGLGFKDSFTKRFSELGGGISKEESFESQDSDFRTQLTKIKATDPDVIYFAGQRMENVIVQARELRITTQILGPSTMQNDDIIEIAGPHAEGIIYTYPNFDSQQESSYQSLYKQKYGKDSEAYAANSYDALVIISQAIDQCGEDSTCIKNYLYGTQNYRGVSGTFSFDKNGDVKRDLILKTILNGEFVKFSK